MIKTLKNKTIDTYNISNDIIKRLIALYKIIPENEKDLIMTAMLLQLKDLIKSKTMSISNTYLVIQILQEMINSYPHKNELAYKKLFNELKILSDYFSTYFSVSKRDLDFICIDKTTKRTFCLNFYIEVGIGKVA